MTIAKWTIKQRKWSIFWWIVGITAFITINLIFYPTIRNQTAQLNRSFDQIPQSARALFTDTTDLFSPVGYLSSQVFYLMLPMLLSILAINLGSNLVAREESDNTLELLLSRPVSRGKLLLNKAVAGLFILGLVGGVTLAVIVALCKLVNMDVGLVAVAVATFYTIVLAALFGAIAFFMSSLGRVGRLASIGVTVLIALGGYIISSLESVVSWLAWPAKFFPFHYYHPGQILYGHYEWQPLIVFAAIILFLGILSQRAFRRRDLTGS